VYPFAVVCFLLARFAVKAAIGFWRGAGVALARSVWTAKSAQFCDDEMNCDLRKVSGIWKQ
jgi:hypothetical protein